MKDIDFDNCVAEPKYNGLRVQVHKKGKAIQVLTAYGNLIPNFKLGGLHVPLKRLKARDGIWDGELFYNEAGATFKEVYAMLKIHTFNNTEIFGWFFRFIEIRAFKINFSPFIIRIVF